MVVFPLTTTPDICPNTLHASVSALVEASELLRAQLWTKQSDNLEAGCSSDHLSV